MSNELATEIVNLNLNIDRYTITVVVDTPTHAVTLTTIDHTTNEGLQAVVDYVYDIAPLIIAGELLNIDTVVATLKSVTEMCPRLEVFI